MRLETVSELNLAIFRAKAARETPHQAKAIPVPIKDHSPEIAALSAAIKELQLEIERLRYGQVRYSKPMFVEEDRPKFPRLSQIIVAVADRYEIEVCEMLSQRRYARFVWPRHIAMYLCSKLTPASLSAIGRAFADRDHTTVLHAVRNIIAKREISDKLRSELDDLKAAILSTV